MQRVRGLGGFFFRARDPEGLAKWYQDHLGINPAPKNMEMAPWVTESGVTVFGPFAADTDYFAAEKTFLLNLRVADLDAMIAQLKSADIEVGHESEMEGIVRRESRGKREGTGGWRASPRLLPLHPISMALLHHLAHLTRHVPPAGRFIDSCRRLDPTGRG